RLTDGVARNTEGTPMVGRPTKDDTSPTDAEVRRLHGACPGVPGKVRVRYGSKPDLADAKTTAWVEVGEKTDFSHEFLLTGLSPDSVIHYAVDSTDLNGTSHGSLVGSFRTAMMSHAPAEVTFAVVTCQMYADLDHADGFHIYPSIGQINPRFVVFTGDN